MSKEDPIKVAFCRELEEREILDSYFAREKMFEAIERVIAARQLSPTNVKPEHQHSDPIDDARIAKIIATTDSRGDFSPSDDGYMYYWSKHGALSAWELRVLADELDKRNTAWDAEVQKTLGASGGVAK
jgi:hypothetical protein